MDFFSSQDALSSLSSMLEESSASNQSNTEMIPHSCGGSVNVVQNAFKKGVVDEKAIWTDAEIPSEDALTDLCDKRPTPKYEICYKQTVGTEDTYFGMNSVSPASSDCTELVIRIHFPGSTMKDLDLDVTKNRIRAESRTLKLFTYFPVPVKHDQGSAKFDIKKEILTVVMPVNNDLDA